MNKDQLVNFFKGFEEAYEIQVLYPKTEALSAAEFEEKRIDKIFAKIVKKMNYGDAQILWIAEQHLCKTFVT